MDARPIIVIGTVDGPSEYQFSGIRGAFRLGDGTFAVADGSRNIRFYDSGGRFTHQYGREGAGPGEFRVISLFRPFAGDSLLVWDQALRRITIFAADGTDGRVVEATTLPGFFFASDVFGDGSLLGISSEDVDLGTAQPGLLATSAAYLRYDPSTAELDTITTLEGIEASYLNGNGTVISVPFSAEPVAAAAGMGVHGGSGMQYEIRTHSAAGDLLRIVRLDRPNPPLDESTTRQFVERLLDRQRTPAARERIASSFRDLPFPATLPAYEKLLVDSGGNLWAAAYAVADSLQVSWTVFGRDGRLLSGVSTPIGFTPYQIGSDWLVGVSEDSLGVERVEMLRLNMSD